MLREQMSTLVLPEGASNNWKNKTFVTTYFVGFVVSLLIIRSNSAFAIAKLLVHQSGLITKRSNIRTSLLETVSSPVLI